MDRFPIGFCKGTIEVISDAYRWNQKVTYDVQCRVCGTKFYRHHHQLENHQSRCKECRRVKVAQTRGFQREDQFVEGRRSNVWRCPKCGTVLRGSVKQRAKLGCTTCTRRWPAPKVGDVIDRSKIIRVRPKTLDLRCRCGNKYTVRNNRRLMTRPCPICFGKELFSHS